LSNRIFNASSLVIKTEFFFQSARGADGMVPAGARQIDWIAGDPGAAGLRASSFSGRVLNVELSIRGILRGFGLKVGRVTRRTLKRGFGNW
jgi:hypothetical protein